MIKENSPKKILIPISLPSSGPGFLKLVISAFGENIKLYALHLTRQNVGFSATSIEAFQPLLSAAKSHSLDIIPVSFNTQNIAEDIITYSNKNEIDLILMGWHRPMLDESILGGPVEVVLRSANASVWVYLERKFNDIKRILLLFNEAVYDTAALKTASDIAFNTNAHLTILHIAKPKVSGQNEENESSIKSMEHLLKDNVEVKIIESDHPLETAVKIANQNYDLIIVGLTEIWGEPVILNPRNEKLIVGSPASILIVHQDSKQND